MSYRRPTRSAVALGYPLPNLVKIVAVILNVSYSLSLQDRRTDSVIYFGETFYVLGGSGPRVLVDDVELGREELGRLLEVYVGWNLRIEIRDLGEE